jgi:hypothetical protein
VDIDVNALITGLLGGGLAGVTVQLIALRRESRVARSAVLQPLAQVEFHRWCDGTTDWPALRQHAFKFEGAAIASGIPKAITETYLAYAMKAYAASIMSMEITDGDSSAIDAKLANGVRDLARLTSDAAWKPRRTWFSKRWRIRAVNKSCANHFRNEADTFMHWKRHYVD